MPNTQAQENYELWNQYERARHDWYRDHVDENIRFYFGQQWTSAERETLKKRGQADIVVNRTRAIIRFLVSMMTANKPSYRAFPVTGGDRKVANIFNEIFSYIWRISNGYKQFERATFSFARAGIGWFLVYYDPRADWGQGEVKIRQVNPKYIYIDASAGEEPDLSDAAAMIISKCIPLSKAQALYPQKAKQLRRALMSDIDMTSAMESEQEIDYADEATDRDAEQGNEQVRIIETYKKKFRPVWIILNPVSGQVELLVKKPKDIESTRIELPYMERLLTAGYDVFISKEELPAPIDNYPLVPMIYEDTENPFPLGEIEFLKGPQRFLNKSMSVTILSAQVGSTPKIILPQGAVDDIKEFQDAYAAPGAVLEARWTGTENKPMIVSPLPLNNAFFSIAQEMKHDMEYESGAFSQLQGDPTNAPQTAAGTLALREDGASKSKLSMRSMESALTRVGQTAMQFVQAYWKQPKVLRLVTDETEQEQEIVVNQTQVDDMGAVVGKLLDLSTGRYDIAISTGSTLPTNRMELLRLHLDLVAQGVPLKYALEYLDVPNAEKIIAEVDQLAQLQGQVEQQQGMLQEAEKEVKSLRTKVDTADRSVRDAQYSANWSKALNQFRAELEVERSRDREHLRSEINEITTDLHEQIRDTLGELKESLAPAPEKGTE